MELGLIDISSSVLICMAWFLFLQLFPLHGITHKVTIFNKHIFISLLVAVLLFIYLDNTLGSLGYVDKDETVHDNMKKYKKKINHNRKSFHATIRSIILIIVLSYYLSYLYSVPFYVVMIPLFGILVFQMYFRNYIVHMIDESNINEQRKIKSLGFNDFINIYLF